MTCTVTSNPASDVFINASTYQGPKVFLERRTQNMITYELPPATCWDAGTYQCYGYNNFTQPWSFSETIDLLVNCTPRPLYPTKQNITFTKAFGGSMELSLTLIAYPRPPSENFHWRKLSNTDWIDVINSTNVSITTTGLESRLTISYLGESDFGQYKLTVSYEEGEYSHTFFVRPQEKPQVPTAFTHLDKYVTQTSAMFKWKPGFNGGLPQTFHILYKCQDDPGWILKNVSSGKTNATINGLPPGALCDVKMYAANKEGRSKNTTILSVSTKPENEAKDYSSIIAGAAGGGGGLALIVIAVVLIVIFMRRRGVSDKNKDQRQSLHKDGALYDENGMEINQAYVSAESLDIRRPTTNDLEHPSSSGDTYAQVNKRSAKGSANDNTYAVVHKSKKKETKGQADIYATPMKKKKADKKRQKQKMKGNEVYENTELNLYNNAGHMDNGSNIYENKEDYQAEKNERRNRNKDGLLYADLAFDNKGKRQLIIHGLDNTTEYAHVDLTKKADPLPDSDDEGDIA